MRYILSISICAILLIGSFGCENAVNNGHQYMDGINIPLDEMNKKYILFDNPGFHNDYKNGHPFSLGIRNLSEDTITFPMDYGVKIYFKQDKNWLPVENNIYYPEGDNVLQTEKDDNTGLVMGFLPKIKDFKGQGIIRVIIIGHTNQRTSDGFGAYLDLKITP